VDYGVGTVTPLGHDYREIGDNLLAGRSGVRNVSRFDCSQHPSQIAGPGKTHSCPPEWDEADFGRLHRLEQAILWCCYAACTTAAGGRKDTVFRSAWCLDLERVLAIWDSDRNRGGGSTLRRAGLCRSRLCARRAAARAVRARHHRVGGLRSGNTH